MPKVRLNWLARALTWLLVCGLWVLTLVQTGRAEDSSLWQEDEQRLRVGLKVFPAVLGAVELLESRRTADGILHLLVVHQGSPANAREAVRSLEGIGEIRGIPLRVQALSLTALDQYPASPVAGVFVASVAVGGARLQAWSQRLQTLVFSPFAGDVEAGAIAGLYVADRVLPYINGPQARRAGVRFKPFFLKVARQYE